VPDNGGNIGHVNPAEALSGDVERELGIFRELLEEELKKSIDILCCLRAAFHGGARVSIREANVDRLIQKDDICQIRPTVGIRCCRSSFRGYGAWAEFEKKSSGRAVSCILFLKSSQQLILHEPGPPFSHRTKGSAVGEARDSKNLRTHAFKLYDNELGTYQKNMCLSLATLKYPEYCLTERSQSFGETIRNRSVSRTGATTNSSSRTVKIGSG
jgi:hypothetical protein